VVEADHHLCDAYDDDDDDDDDDDLDDFEVYEPSNYRGAYRIQRMTTSSRLPISSFCGQECHMNHEVYCLPIVMDDMEWNSASTDDKTFVLIFNTAVCNHLWGMYFQQHEEEQHQDKHEHKQPGRDDDNENDQSKRAFLAANQLYRLALSNGNKVGRSTPNESANPAGLCSSSSIDYQLCLVAVLNNLSHISKTLMGTDSYEAHQFDRMLLKAIFWFRDSRDQRRASTASNDSTTNYGIYDYEDDDAEIIDLFLEYVFYLIGVSDAVAPAAVA
jgi:hypothetical protein